MLSLIKSRRSTSAKEAAVAAAPKVKLFSSKSVPMDTTAADRPPSRVATAPAPPSERPPSRIALPPPPLPERPASALGDRPPSRNRTQQPRLGVSSSYEDTVVVTPSVTPELRMLPRTSPNQYPVHRQPRDALPPPPTIHNYDEDSGIMSEAETASTTRSSKQRRSSRNHHHHHHLLQMNSLSLNRHHVVSNTLYEEDPGIMSEAETASTSSKSRRHHQKYLLPVVRTPSKTLERPLGMVFLIYRGETKRALLPNEITSVITVKALFVRSFNKVLTMDYMDSPRVKIYIHDSAKDIFFELDDLGEVRDRTILKVFEADSSGKGPGGLGPSGMPPITNEEPDYVDSRVVKANKRKDANGTAVRPASSLAMSSSSKSSVLRGGGNMQQRLNGRRVESGYVSSPDNSEETRIMPRFSSLPSSSNQQQIQQQQQLQAQQQPQQQHQHGRYYPGPANAEEAKARMMHMEAQLSQLTGMVEKALKNKKLGKKQVSFDKSVTFNDEVQVQQVLQQQQQQQQQQQPSSILTKRHVVQNVATVVVPPPQSLQQQPLQLTTPELSGRLRRLHRSTRELKQEVRVLKRLTQLQSMAMKDLVQDTYLKLREACVSFSSQNGLLALGDLDMALQDEELFSRELTELLQKISELEVRVEEVRSGVINKKSKILLQDVEAMAVDLSQCGKTAARLRQAFPPLMEAANLREMTAEFLKRSLENAWKRCRKLTGTLVTLRRLASVQEQRFHPAGGVAAPDVSAIPGKESSLDDLLDALQTYTQAKPVAKAKAAPPPPPPRTSSAHKGEAAAAPAVAVAPPAVPPKPKEGLLESRHLELLSRQRQLQEQYQRLQEMQKKSNNNNNNKMVVVAKEESGGVEEEVVAVAEEEVETPPTVAEIKSEETDVV